MTMLTRLTMPRIAAGSRLASVSKRASGSESTRPRPKSGVVRRPLSRIVAPAGSVSTPVWQFKPGLGLKPPMPKSWRSEPPVLSIPSNRPLTTRP